MPDIADDLAWHGDPARRGARRARPRAHRAGRCAHGARRASWSTACRPATRCVLTLDDARTAGLAAELATTRSAAAVELWRPHLDGAVVAIGNAPTALFHLLERLRDWPERPAAILAFPVGFVGAAESKEALVASGLDVPWVTLRGRRGGSAMAAAAINALLVDTGVSLAHRRSASAPTAWMGWAGGRATRSLQPRCWSAAQRHLAMLPEDGQAAPGLALAARRHAAGAPGAAPATVAVLATGDPLWYGVGRLLLQPFPAAEVSDPAARLGLPGGVQPARLGARGGPAARRAHGRPIAALRRHLQPGRRLLVLTADGDAPGRDRAAASSSRLRRQPDLGPGGAGRPGRAA